MKIYSQPNFNIRNNHLSFKGKQEPNNDGIIISIDTSFLTQLLAKKPEFDAIRLENNRDRASVIYDEASEKVERFNKLKDVVLELKNQRYSADAKITSGILDSSSSDSEWLAFQMNDDKSEYEATFFLGELVEIQHQDKGKDAILDTARFDRDELKAITTTSNIGRKNIFQEIQVRNSDNTMRVTKFNEQTKKNERPIFSSEDGFLLLYKPSI